MNGRHEESFDWDKPEQHGREHRGNFLYFAVYAMVDKDGNPARNYEDRSELFDTQMSTAYSAPFLFFLSVCLWREFVLLRIVHEKNNTCRSVLNILLFV